MRIRFVDKKLGRLYSDPEYQHPKKFDGNLVDTFIRRVTLIKSVDNQLELRKHKSLHLEKLSGGRKKQHSVRLDGKWRLILEFEKDDSGRLVAIIEIVDYH